MQPTPTEAAQQEFDLQQAAFERARQKLAAARKVTEWRHATTLRDQGKTALIIGVTDICLALMAALFLWRAFPSMWSDLGKIEHQAAAMVPALLFLSGVALVAVGWYMQRKVPTSGPQLAIMEFFRRVNTPAQHSRLAEMLADGSAALTARRALPSALTAKLAIPTYWNLSLVDYWATLTQDGNGVPSRYHFKPRNIRIHELAPDLCLSTFDLLRPRELSGRFVLLVAVLAGFAIGAPLALINIWTDGIGTSVIAPASMAICFLAKWLLERHAQTFKVRKLLVRRGSQWRLFCGDWEAYEEADLAWLDQMPTASAPTA